MDQQALQRILAAQQAQTYNPQAQTYKLFVGSGSGMPRANMNQMREYPSRARMDGLDELTEVVRIAEMTANEESDHDIRMRVVRRPDRYVVSVHVVCAACRQHTRWEITQESLFLAPDQVRNEAGHGVARALGQLIERPCMAGAEFQLISEWVTRRLVAAGEHGVPFPQLLEEVWQEMLTVPGNPAADKSKILRAIYRCRLHEAEVAVPGTTWKLPVMTLPKGHPMRVW